MLRTILSALFLTILTAATLASTPAFADGRENGRDYRHWKRCADWPDRDCRTDWPRRYRPDHGYGPPIWHRPPPVVYHSPPGRWYGPPRYVAPRPIYRAPIACVTHLAPGAAIHIGHGAWFVLDRWHPGCFGWALEQGQPQQAYAWQASDASRYQIVPLQSFDDGARYCREYQAQAEIGGRLRETYGTACRQPDGSWQLMD